MAVGGQLSRGLGFRRALRAAIVRACRLAVPFAMLAGLHALGCAVVAAAGKTFYAQLAAERKLVTVPADAAESARLAARYTNPALGEIAVSRSGGVTVFDFGEWKSEVASRKNPDGTISFLTTAPGIAGFEFVVGPGEKQTLVTRDAQHEYVFEQQ